MSLQTDSTSDFESQGANDKATSNTQAVGDNDVTHRKMIEFEPLLEASGERNLRSINLTHGKYPYPCLCGIKSSQTYASYGMSKKFGRLGYLAINRSLLSSRGARCWHCDGLKRL